MKTTLEDVVRPGMVVSGYRIEKKLGAGGFGKVFPFTGQEASSKGPTHSLRAKRQAECTSPHL